MVRSCDSPMVGAYRVLTDKGDKMLKIELKWLYLSLWKTNNARYCYSDVTLAVGEVYDSLDPIGQRSKSTNKLRLS